MAYKVIDGKLVKTRGGKIVQVRSVRHYVDLSRGHGAHRDAPRPVPQGGMGVIKTETRVAPVPPRRENGCVFPPDPKDFPKDKGLWDGACNRRACLAYPALWYNRGSYAFYCEECAHMLNEVNRNDEFCRTGGPLCRKIETKEEAENLHVMPHK